jgi:hypothetical protein
MNNKTKGYLLSAVLATGMMLGVARGAAAHPSAQVLPPIKAPASQMSDLVGSITIGPQVLKLDGTGSQAGDRFQFDLNITPEGSPDAITLKQVQVGQMYYFMLTGIPGWQMIDLSKTPGNVPNIQSEIPGLNGFNPNGAQRTFDAVKQIAEVGKEDIDGMATTKYQGDVDIVKLFTSIGIPAAQAQQAALVSKLTVYLWIGDADGFIHQTRGVLNTKAVGPGAALLDVMVDFTLTNRDFGAPVSITAPTDAVPYEPNAPEPPQVSPTEPEKTPEPEMEDTSVVPGGMPTTGAGDPIALFVALGSGLVLFMLGMLLRRLYATIGR